MVAKSISLLLLRNLLLILFAYVVFLTPILFFGDGFFLRRVEFPDKSVEHGKPVYKRAVILLIDALSFQFVQPQPQETGRDSEYFANKLTVFQDTLADSQKRDRAKLFKFIADPPTTTMQRIKALSTGSLSTFIEIAANFFSSEIQEDSWIYQSKVVGNGTVALGDDTWGGLFPTAFKRSHLLPSFNVKDLDTVDNGVLDHLFGELTQKDWSVLLAHFLGVDHCGHTYGRNHPEMSRKLKQMDQTIRRVLEQLDDETILFVLGDHGMTPNGDHGGDSDLETASALFVYAPKHNFSDSTEEIDLKVEEIYQTDFIPSISLLMGWPIPFSSIGSLVAPFFDRETYLESYAQNSRQLKTYFDKYFNERRTDVERAFQDAISKGDHKKFHNMVRETCEAAWVKFNLTLVFGGIFGSVVGLALIVIVLSQIESISLKKLTLSLLFSFLPLVLLVLKVVAKFDLLNGNDFLSIAVLNSTLLILLASFVKQTNLDNLKYENFQIAFVLVPLLLAKFSNSYTIYEPYVTLLVLLAFVLIRTWRMLSQILPSLPGKMWRNLIAAPLNVQVMYACLLLIVLRLQLGFVSCREEHGPTCEQSSMLTPMLSLVLDQQLKNSSYLLCRFLLGAVTIFTLAQFFRNLANKRGNLSSFGFVAQLYSPGLYILAFLVVLDWLTQAARLSSINGTAPSKHGIPTSLLNLFPRLAYGFFGLIFVALSVQPLIFAQKTEQDLVAERFDQEDIDPSNPKVMKELFEFIKIKYKSGLDPNIPNLYVFGLGSVISCAWQLIYVASCLLVILILGDGLAPACFLVASSIFLFYKLEMSSQAISIALMVHLVQNLAFYVTGHHATWTHIKWQAAFVGFDQVPDFFAIPGALILTNTYAGNLLAVLSIPLFILWPVVEMNGLPRINKNNSQEKSSDEQQGECGFIKQPQMLADPLVRICLMFMLSTGVEIVASALAACFLRRHLMAYKIFVPRLIFAILSSAYNFLLLVAVVCFPLYVLWRLAKWRKY